MQKQFRLKRRSAFNYVYKKGEKSSARHLLLLYTKSRGGIKIGISVSKKVGGAVVRNRVKRLIREGVNRIFPEIQRGYTYVIVAKSTAAEGDFYTITEDVKDIFLKAGKYVEKTVL